MREEDYYAEIVDWVKRVVSDKQLSDEEKVRLLGRVL